MTTGTKERLDRNLNVTKCEMLIKRTLHINIHFVVKHLIGLTKGPSEIVLSDFAESKICCSPNLPLIHGKAWLCEKTNIVHI